jgi:endonuclease/exonuclease/phosphatase family metal-dependent hydrolase
VVLMGDLNMNADRAARSSGYEVLARHPTFPVDDPREQLDHVLSDRPLRVQASRAPAMGLSDHRALVVDLP